MSGSLTPEQTDALATWFGAVLEDIQTQLVPGHPGWDDLQAKQAIIRDYRQTRAMTALPMGDVERVRVDAALRKLGWVMRVLARPYAAGRDGWVTAWRTEG